MNRDDVQIGAVYTARVTNKVVEVRIDAGSPHGGWDATNLAPGRTDGPAADLRARTT